MNIHDLDGSLPGPSEAGYGASALPQFNLSDAAWILRRAWRLPLFGLLVGLAIGVTYLAFVPPMYTSGARVLIERSVSRFLQTNNIADELTLDDSDIASQLYVLSSDSIILPVVRSMGLANDPEFVGRPNQSDSEVLAVCQSGISLACATSYSKLGIKKAVRFAKQWMGLKPESALETDAARERIAVDKLLSRLVVMRGDVPSVIDIFYSSRDPKKASDIANAIADTYLGSISERKLKSNKMISHLLEERLVDLKEQYLAADKALQDFKADHKLASPVADNQLISTLRSQYVALAAKANQIEDVVGPTHLAVIKLHKQMDEMDAAIRSEEQRVASLDPTAGAANGQSADMSTDDQGFPKADDSARIGPLDSQSQVKLRQLAISATTLRNLYNTAQRQFSEITQVRPDTQDAHIITRATPALEMSSQKKRLAIFGGGIVFGLLAGMGAALGKEWLADVFRTPEQVRRATGLYCAVLPSIEHGRNDLSDYVIDAPYSRFTETFRNIRALISATQRGNGSKVICVVSSISHEGKTTVANNLAALLSASTYRTLIMDCDLHRRKMTMELAPDARVGLAEALQDPSQLAAFVTKRERSGADVLPFTTSERLPAAAELLGSAQMEKLLDAARKEYDFIVLEVAPIMSVVDIKMIGRFIDQFVFVIEWGETRRRLVQEALSEVEFIRDRIICAILNRADPATLKNIEAYKGPRIGAYYVG